MKKGKSMLTHLGTTRNCQYKAANPSEKELKKWIRQNEALEKKEDGQIQILYSKKFILSIRNSAVEY